MNKITSTLELHFERTLLKFIERSLNAAKLVSVSSHITQLGNGLPNGPKQSVNYTLLDSLKTDDQCTTIVDQSTEKSMRINNRVQSKNYVLISN